jgi:hypothetical protein
MLLDAVQTKFPDAGACVCLVWAGVRPGQGSGPRRAGGAAGARPRSGSGRAAPLSCADARAPWPPPRPPATLPPPGPFQIRFTGKDGAATTITSKDSVRAAVQELAPAGAAGRSLKLEIVPCSEVRAANGVGVGGLQQLEPGAARAATPRWAQPAAVCRRRQAYCAPAPSRLLLSPPPALDRAVGGAAAAGGGGGAAQGDQGAAGAADEAHRGGAPGAGARGGG